MCTLSVETLRQGVVCASAGNHAQGVALACRKLETKGRIYMPSVTPQQKINKVKLFGKEFVEIVLTGDTFDDAYSQAIEYAQKEGKIFVHPFDNERVIEGQATVALEILETCPQEIDYVFVPVGGGGLLSGLGSFFKQVSPQTKIIGIEPAGAPSMKTALELGKVITLDRIDPFVDGAAVKRVGERTFQIAQQVCDDLLLVEEGKVCSTMLHLYSEEGIIVEPAGALSIAALDQYREQIKGKCVVCIVSGGNNDITRTEEIRERALLYEGLKHYFVIRFPQRAGALREFLNYVLGPSDDITHFEYTKKHNRDSGPALVGIQVQKKGDYEGLIQRMEQYHISFQTVNDSAMLFDLLV
jgi:threonine dehydratase